jgi:hypothetical protein
MGRDRGAQPVEPFHAGHAVIEQHQIERALAAHLCQRLGQIMGGGGLHRAIRAKEHGKGFAHHVMVVGNQYSQLHGTLPQWPLRGAALSPYSFIHAARRKQDFPEHWRGTYPFA